MAVVIRLRRMGTKRKPFYRLVVADSRCPKEGRFIENLGKYNPLKNPAELSVNEERALYWLSQGAKVSPTARQILRKTEVWEKFKPQKTRSIAPSS